MDIQIKEALGQLFPVRITKTLRVRRPWGGDSVVKLRSKVDVDGRNNNMRGIVCVCVSLNLVRLSYSLVRAYNLTF